MKTNVLSFFIAALLGLASYFGGHFFDAGELIAVFFTAGLMAWTIILYRRKPRLLTVARPLHLPLRLNHENLRMPVPLQKLAA